MKENLPILGKDDKLVDRIGRYFLIKHNNRSPLIPSNIRKYIISSVVDRHIFEESKQTELDEKMNNALMSNLFKDIDVEVTNQVEYISPHILI